MVRDKLAELRQAGGCRNAQPSDQSAMQAMKRYSPGKTCRINITTVREDVCAYNTDTPEMLLRFWSEVIAKQPDHEPDKETVVVVMLNTRLRPYAWHRVALGTVNECPAHCREVFRPVIAAGAYGFAIMHSHPSGEASPSRADETITRRINEAATLLQIRLIDHVIVGEPSTGRSPYFSFRETGLIS